VHDVGCSGERCAVEENVEGEDEEEEEPNHKLIA
jgi:hypothetical protein